MVTFFTILQVIAGLAVILAVLFQSGKSAGLSGAIAGAADILEKVLKFVESHDRYRIIYHASW